ncbi:glycosyltransferase [Algibacter sp. L4_22]|uniref:glycosyltransferase n=1 Tax=Algibacter sp. L4_22 TaxID=2942477 RepID=UPI00201B60FE|nr:glycosyltransferase [Algibacter sp. L4_22]MCL5127854.1 glycosyltransferase [Algibacter sp. L4_22]
MKKIVFVIESLQCGGAEKSLVTLLQNFDYQIYDVDLIINIENSAFQKFLPKEVNLKIINIFSELNILLLLYLRMSFKIKKKINKNKKHHNAQLYWDTFGKYAKKIDNNYDIAIAYNQGLATYFVAEKIKANKKFAWLNIDYYQAGYNINFDINKYRVFNKVVTVSKECNSSFESELNKYNFSIETTVIKDITDVDIVNKLASEHIVLSTQENITNICSVGRLAEQKGWHLAISAMEILVKRGRNIKWYIIGEGPKRQELEILIEEKKLKENLILLGYKENPYPYIKSCDIYVQTSLFEGLGLTVIEASILKRPIVTTNFPTAYTIIENNITGLICDMNPNAIADSIETYIDNEKLKGFVIKNLSLRENTDKEDSLEKISLLLN